MTKLIFIRYARLDSRIQDDVTRPLAEAGRAAAARLPKLFKDTSIDHIYSSPFLRSIHTVKPLADAKGLTIKESANLQERKIGEWVLGTYRDVRNQYISLSFVSSTILR